MLRIQHARCDVAAKACCPAEGHKIPSEAAMCGVRDGDDAGAQRGHERVVVDGGCGADWRDVVVLPAQIDVKLQVCTHAQQVGSAKGDPVPQRPANAQKRERAEACPATNLLRVALAKAHLVALVPTPFGGVPCVFPVDPGFEQYFLKWHRLPRLCGIFALNSGTAQSQPPGA